jgi:hypothetical protein
MVTLFENKTVETTRDNNEAVKSNNFIPVQPPMIPTQNENSTGNEANSDLSSIVLNFLDNYDLILKEKKDLVDTPIRVSEVFGRLARIYERIRTTVEYKGEHVLRRNAIERILKRLTWEKDGLNENADVERIAANLLRELIWARYLPNNAIPKHRIIEVEKVIEKYLYVLRNLNNIPTSVPITKIRSWLWGVASSEIEDFLDPSNRELYVKLMYDWFNNFFIWEDSDIPEHDRQIQIYLAIHRSLPKSDEPIMRYHLLLKEMPNWKNAENHEMNEFLFKFPIIYAEIEKHLYYPGRYALYRKIQKHAGAFEIFQTISKEDKGNLKNLIKDETKLQEEIVATCNIRYKQIKKKVSTGIVRSIIYIFLTKVFLALLIEVPYELYKFQDIRYIPLVINMLFPPALMFFIGLSIKLPGDKNTNSIIQKIRSFVYKTDIKQKNILYIYQSQTRSSLINIFYIIYLISIMIIFGLLAYLLLLLNFTLIGIGIFFIFLSLVLLFTFRVNYSANQLKVESEHESALGYLFNYLTLPFLNVGFYLSKGLAKINFFTVILDFIIEAPFKTIIEIFEEWTSFMREKKEEVIEMPE